MSDYFKTLEPLVRQKSSLTDIKQFHAIVNVVFHDHEAKYYNNLHAEMWQSLPQQYELLVADLFKHITPAKTLKLLDVGCGTGLATEMVLDTQLGDFITEVNMLDTSQEMLKEAFKRSKNWHKKTRIIHGSVDELKDSYDLIVISSVLHHIPDLAPFLQRLSELQKPGGLILTLHDPASEALKAEKYAIRRQQYLDYTRHNYIPLPLKTRVLNKVRRLLKGDDYISSVNKTLLKNKIIKEPLTAPELWSITDIHVEDLPYSANQGIALACLTQHLPNYKLLSYRTYGFFGTLSSNLPPHFKKAEKQLALEGDKFGRNFGSIWVNNNHI